MKPNNNSNICRVGITGRSQKPKELSQHHSASFSCYKFLDYCEKSKEDRVQFA